MAAFKEVSLSQTGDTVVVVNTTAADSTQSSYVVHVSPSDDGGEGEGSEGEGTGGGVRLAGAVDVRDGIGLLRIRSVDTVDAGNRPAARSLRCIARRRPAGPTIRCSLSASQEPHTGEGTVWEGRIHCVPPDLRHLGANFDIPWTAELRQAE